MYGTVCLVVVCGDENRLVIVLGRRSRLRSILSHSSSRLPPRGGERGRLSRLASLRRIRLYVARIS